MLLGRKKSIRLIPKVLLIAGLAMVVTGFALMQIKVEEIRYHSCISKENCSMLVYNAPYGMLGYNIMIYGIGITIAGAIPIVYNIGNVKKKDDDELNEQVHN